MYSCALSPMTRPSVCGVLDPVFQLTPRPSSCVTAATRRASCRASRPPCCGTITWRSWPSWRLPRGPTRGPVPPNRQVLRLAWLSSVRCFFRPCEAFVRLYMYLNICPSFVVILSKWRVEWLWVEGGADMGREEEGLRWILVWLSRGWVWIGRGMVWG